MRLKDKAAIVTGAAGGIGRAIALAFVTQGASVVATDINRAGLEQTGTLAGPKCVSHVADVASAADWRAVAALARDRVGAVHVLVNNAVWNVVKPITDLADAEWTRIFDVGLTAAFLGMKTAIPMMVAAGGGVIINICSVHHIHYYPGHPAYAAMKGGLASLTCQVALEYGPKKIRCNTISPGFVETERTLAYPSEDDRRMNLEAHPIGRVGHADDIASAAVFLASDEAGFITGVDLVVDGGATLAAPAAYLKPSLRAMWRASRIHMEDEP